MDVTTDLQKGFELTAIVVEGCFARSTATFAGADVQLFQRQAAFFESTIRHSDLTFFNFDLDWFSAARAIAGEFFNFKHRLLPLRTREYLLQAAQCAPQLCETRRESFNHASAAVFKEVTRSRIRARNCEFQRRLPNWCQHDRCFCRVAYCAIVHESLSAVSTKPAAAEFVQSGSFAASHNGAVATFLDEVLDSLSNS
jgi:hypothetical protein